MKQIIAYLIIVLNLFCSCNNNPTKDSSDKNEHHLKILSLGDSYTAGQNVTKEETFPHQLAGLFKQKELAADEPVVVAKTGWTTADLLQSISELNRTDTFDIVTVLIGVNNQYQALPLTQFRPEFEKILQAALHYAANRAHNIYALSIPDYSYTPFAQNLDPLFIRKQLADYNKAVKEIAERFHVRFIDITPITIKAATDSRFMANDGLHYSAEEYKLWAEEILRRFQNH